MCMGASFLYNSAGLTFIDVTIQEKHTEVGFAIVRHGRYVPCLILMYLTGLQIIVCD